MIVFKYYPTLTAMLKSFYDWDGYRVSIFVGLKNYMDLFQDDIYLMSMRNVFLIALASVVKVLIFPLLTAELICRVKRKRWKEAYKYIFVIPMVVPQMVSILMWQWIYNPSFGALNQFLELFGISMNNHAWLGSADTALFSIIFVGFPWIGGTAFLIFLGGLQAVSEDMHEAAIIDGASALQIFFKIDIPSIWGQLRLVVVTTIIDAFSNFENVLVLTNGGPGDHTMVPALHMYQQGLTYYKMGYACTIGMSIFLVVLIMTLISFRIKKGNDI